MRLITHSVAALSALTLGPLLAGAALLRPSLRAGAGARLGRGPFLHEDPISRVWLHASSVGEAKVACRLSDALEASGHALRATTMTQTGLELFERDRPGLRASFAPLDHPWCVEPVLRRGNPKLSVLIETELWPSWIGACARHDVPVVVASGRLSDRSFPRYRKARSLIRGTLDRIDAVGARTDLDAARFVELGVPESRVRVTGDLKLDPPEEQPALAIDLIRALADVPAVVGGSTHQGEEAALLDALEAAEKAGHGFVLVLAPRRIERAEELVRLCQGRRRRVFRRSQLEGRHLVPGEVLILDSFGELAAMYATASIAFVGGTLVDVGGHNVVEPLHTGCPVLYGPRTENVRKVVEIIEVGGAGARVETGEALSRAVVATFDDLEASRQRGELGRERLAEHRGSVARTVGLIEETLERRGKTLPMGSGARGESASPPAPVADSLESSPAGVRSLDADVEQPESESPP